MGDIQGESVKPAAIPKKRSLFNKEARKNLSESAKDIEFFSRQEDIFEQTLKENKLKEERKLAKLERKRSSKSAELKEEAPVESKKLRTSGLRDEGDGYSSREGSDGEDGESPPRPRRESSHTSPESRATRTSIRRKDESPMSLTARYARDLQAKKSQPAKAKGYISLSDNESENEGGRQSALLVRNSARAFQISDDEDEAIYIKPTKAEPLPDDDDLQLSEDEEFPEFVKAAKERARLKAEQRAEAAKKVTEDTADISDTFDNIFDTPKIEKDPFVELFITSRMENTKPLIVKRKLSHRLREAKFAWCDKQMLDGCTIDDFRKSVFLTWGKHRVHDTTTSESLYDTEKTDVDGRIHLEAWTEPAYEEYQAWEAEKARKEQEIREGKIEQAPKEVKTRLILKGKDMDDFKLSVKPTTNIEKIIMAFRNTRQIPESQAISLYFDGDKLDPELTVEEADLGELDTIEVHMK